MSYELFLTEHLTNVKIRGMQATARCPWHEDKRSSLSVNITTGQWMCFAGCGHGNMSNFARRLGVLSPSPTQGSYSIAHRDPGVSAIKNAASSPAGGDGGGLHSPEVKSKIEATYDYQYEDGSVAYQVVRFTPKSFAQRRMINGKWAWGVPGDVRRVPFHLPAILKTDKWILLVEGEKDVLKLESLNLVSTTTPMGAGSWNCAYAQYFRGKRVAILPDNDPPGDAYAGAASADLTAAGVTVKVVRLPGLEPKGDVSDYLAIAGNSRETLLDLVRNTQECRAVHNPHEHPVKYFARHDIAIDAGDNSLPSEYRTLCKKSFLDISRGLKAEDNVFGLIAEAEGIWKNVSTKKEYEQFLWKMMEAHAA